MTGLPYNMPLTSQIMPNQSVPVQTSHNNFLPFQQPQPVVQQMQTAPSVAYPTNPQDPFKQPFYQLHQADVLVANHQYTPNLLPPKYPYPPAFHTQHTVSPVIQTQQPSYNPLPQNVLDQIRNTVSSAAPIFILPSGCHQATNQASNSMNQGGVAQQTGQSTGFNCPIYCPPSFYPYPLPFPMFDSFGTQARCKDGPRGYSCCHQKRNALDSTNYPLSCCCNMQEMEEHRCTATHDDTICSKRNCPSSISLQALASQLLSLPGIISCAATRLILRKVAGSNITNTMEDIMEKAQKSIGSLTKDQLLVESRNAQQVNALINLHMTTTPPANIIPLLTLLQLKVNVLKAQVESLINKKVMECQGYGFEVETSGPIDPTVLTMKTNAELRQLLSALRQKECDERVNANFSPYHSQRVIAEARLNNVQAKIRQVEAEFERRRCMTVPTPTLTSRIIQQFSESRCMIGFAHANIFDPYVQRSTMDSPDPFVPCIRNPRKLYLKPREPGQETAQGRDENETTSEGTSMCKDTGTGEGNVNSSKDKGVESKSSEDTCSCEGTSSEESLDEDKKKLRLKIDEGGKVTISCGASLRDVSLLRLASNVVTRIRKVCKKGRGQGKGVKEVRRVSRDGEEVDEEMKKDEEEVNSGDKLVYVKDGDTDSEDFELFIFEEDPGDESSDSEDLDLFIFQEDPDGETQIKEDIKEEPESIESIRIPDSADIPIKKESKSMEKIGIPDSVDTPIKKEPESVEEIRTGKDIPIKEESTKQDEEKKSPQYTTVKSVNVEPETKVTELYVEPKVKTETHKAEAYIYVVPQVPVDPHVKTAMAEKSHVELLVKTEAKPQSGPSYIAPKIKTHPKTLGIPLNVPKVTMQPQTHAAPLYVVPKPKTEPKTQVVPRTHADPHVKTMLAEMLHVEPAVETESGPSFAVPKVITRPKPQGAPLFAVPKVKTEPKPRATPLYAVSKVKEEPELMNPEGNKVLETRETDESWSTPFVRTQKFEDDGEALKGKSTVEDVSKNQGTGSEAAEQWKTPEEGRSSDLHESTFYMIKPITKKKRVIRILKKEDELVSNENGGSQRKDSKERNVQFVSMMTRVKYNRRFGDFGEWNINECNVEKTEDSSRDVEKINTINENQAHFPSENENPLINIQQCESLVTTEKNNEIDENFTTGLKCFPPLKHAEPKSARTTTFETRFHQRKIESKTVCDSNTFYHHDSETENSIASRIYSMIENQFVSFGSLLSNIPNIQDVMSNLHFDKLSRNTFNENDLTEQVDNATNNKRELNEKDDWTLLPLNTNASYDDEHATSGGNYVSAYEGCRNVREIKHSIIVDKEKENYVVIRGSISGQFRELSRNGFKRPYQTRRSLIIRSRLKNPEHSKNEYVRPFTVFKRPKRSQIFVSEAMKQTERKLKFREKLLSLPEALEDMERLETVDDNNLNNNEKNEEHTEVSQEAIFQQNSKHSNDLNNNYSAASLNGNEHVTDVQDNFNDIGINRQT
ncbi:PREDICTED: uncharacterized protein LOC108578039 [Habropoda laboriosa]|uniref:uncharacterized protein LOC108578039 n=1 Tax=Habropoda laboriosa TaxID=597456 RepID=UPI00083E39EE|nr:PREDICTED: uncharacterized protein LOC108578039 [Habropoda laboriosa]